VGSHAAQIRARGYAVFEGLLDPGETASLRREVEGVIAEIDPPGFFAADTVQVADGVAVTSTGLAISRLLTARPALRPLVLRAPVIEAMRALLGPDARLELLGAVASDARRPFFSWHTHIDGEEEGERVKRGVWPPVEGISRVLTLLYLDDLDDESGPLYVYPRREGDPTPPPHPLDEEAWPDMVELRPKAGDLVALEQCTWHAAKSLRRPGLRLLVGAYFAAADAPRPSWLDEGLAAAPLL